MGLTPVPPDHVATVVTTLAITTRPASRPIPPSPFSLIRSHAPEPDRYRQLFRRIGERWLWYSRLAMTDVALAAKLASQHTELYVATDAAGGEIGMLELDFATAGVAELAYLGLTPELTGQGHGRWLMAHALALGWRAGVTRMTVNTCTLDHPAALGFYRAQGFEAVSRTLETFPDPRALGLLPDTAAPQIPYLAKRR